MMIDTGVHVGGVGRFCLAAAMVAVLLSATASAQPHFYDVWHFGENAAIDFRLGDPPVATTGQPMQTLEGCSVICDSLTGDLLFFTDGMTVWDRTNAVMQFGDTLFGHWSTTQSVLVVPDPGTDYRHYVFTLDNRSSPPYGNRGLRYSIVDMRGNSGLGMVTSKNTLVQDRVAEKIVAVRHQSGCGYWIIVHSLLNDRFYAWLLTASGLSKTPVISPIGKTYQDWDIGYLKASPDGSWLFAVRGFGSYSLADPQFGELFRFDARTGRVTQKVTELPALYGASFSPNNRFLYTSKMDTVLRYDSLVQYDLRLPPSEVADSGVVIDVSIGLDFGPFEWTSDLVHGAMQIGPDGKIYVVYGKDWWQQFLGTPAWGLGVINNPNQRGLAASYTEPPELLFNVVRTNYGLPNAIDGYIGESDALAIGEADPAEDPVITGDTTICRGSSVQLLLEDREYYAWNRNTSLTCWDCKDPIATPDRTSLYIVETIGQFDCGRIDTIRVTVVDPPNADAGNDTVVCVGQLMEFSASGGETYSWDPDPALSSLVVSNPVALINETRTFYVTVTDSTGCSARDSIRVRVRSSEAKISASTSEICLGDSVTLSAAGGDGYLWNSTAAVDCPECETLVVRPTETTTYRLTATIGSGCPTEDSVTIVVNEPPRADAGRDTTVCAGLPVLLRGTGDGDYRWRPSASLDCDTCAAPTATPLTTTTYVFRVTNEFGCEDLDSVTVMVEEVEGVIAGGDTAFCPGGAARLSVSGAEQFQWFASDGSETLSCDDCADPIAMPTRTTTYYVLGTDRFGDCPSRDSVTVVVHPLPVADAGPDTAICVGTDLRLAASGGVGYRWEQHPDLSCLDCPDPVATPSGEAVYRVTVTNAEGCESSDSVTVRLLPQPLISAGPDSETCFGDSVQLQASGGARWLWEPAAGLSCSDCPNPVASPSTTTTYKVTAWNEDGCVASDEVRVAVREEPEIIRLRIDDSYRVMIGQSYTIPVRLRGPVNRTDINAIDLILRYDEGMVVLDAGSIEALLSGTLLEGWGVELVSLGGGELRIRLTAPAGETLKGVGSAGGDLIRFTGRSYLGENAGSSLEVEAVTESNCFFFESTPGYIRVDSICGLNFRLIESGAEKYVPPHVYPNPAHSIMTFEFSLGLDGRTQMEIVDLIGNRVGLLVDEHLSEGGYSVEWDVRDIPTGVYRYIIRSGDWSRSGEVRVVR